MKKLIYLLFILLLLQSACKKDQKASDFVTDYTPSLTEAKNTVYTGDYYPFATGYSWNWSGTETTSGSMTVTAEGQHQTEPLNGTEDVTGYMYVNEPETISLPSGSYTVLPTSETDGTSRYFQVSDTAVIIRAILMEGMSSPVEVTNPVFLRKPLIVGDEWQSQPTVDFNQLLSQLGMSDMGSVNMTIKCLIFVLGKENISWNGSTTSALALEERASVVGTIDVNDGGATGSININFTLDSRLDLKEDIGLVQNAMILKGTMSGTISDEGESASLSMNLSMNSTLSLDSYSLTPSGLMRTPVLKSGEPVILKKSSGNPMADKQFKKVMLILKKIQNGLILK